MGAAVGAIIGGVDPAFYTLITRTFRNAIVRGLILWISIPLAVLTFMDWLEPVTRYLDSISMEVGNIRLSALGVIRVVVLDRSLLARTAFEQCGQAYDPQSGGSGYRHTGSDRRKLFEVGLYVVIFILLLQIMGINITALAVSAVRSPSDWALACSRLPRTLFPA